MTSRLARDIAHLAHGKALYSLAPVLGALSHEKREIVYRVLGEEYLGFDDSVQRLLDGWGHSSPPDEEPNGP